MTESTTVRVACLQTSPVVGDPAGDRAAVAEGARAAAAADARIVVAPELAACGYSFRDAAEALAAAEPADGEAVTEWAALAAELGIVLVAGFAELGDDGRPYNAAVLVGPRGERAHYRKVHLWDAEQLVFEAGSDAPPVVDTEWGRIAVMVCYDLEFPEWVRTAALAGADLICAPVNWPLLPRPEGERPGEVVRVQADASVNRVAIAACDRAGDDRGAAWLGGSVIVDQDGYPVTAPILGRPGMVIADLDLAVSRDKRVSPSNDVLDDRRPDLYGAVAE
ncbi:nitrilase-related carbon-nitrogen hydrolase [Agromyces bauzanensis]